MRDGVVKSSTFKTKKIEILDLIMTFLKFLQRAIVLMRVGSSFLTVIESPCWVSPMLSLRGGGRAPL